MQIEHFGVMTMAEVEQPLENKNDSIFGRSTLSHASQSSMKREVAKTQDRVIQKNDMWLKGGEDFYKTMKN